MIATLSAQTCGDACWHAREDICHCSCGGANHGCLRSTDGEQLNRVDSGKCRDANGNTVAHWEVK